MFVALEFIGFERTSSPKEVFKGFTTVKKATVYSTLGRLLNVKFKYNFCKQSGTVLAPKT